MLRSDKNGELRLYSCNGESYAADWLLNLGFRTKSISPAPRKFRIEKAKNGTRYVPEVSNMYAANSGANTMATLFGI